MFRAARFWIAFAALLMVAAPVRAAGAKFLAEIDDLPLAPGLTELPGGTLFDAPTGRIVEANATGRMFEVEVRQFYDETLPELGWQHTGIDTYRRDKEVLTIAIATDGMEIKVHFSLAPAGSGDKGTKP